MIDLMLDCHRLKTGGGYFPDTTFRLGESDQDLRGTLHIAGIVGNAHASLAHDGSTAMLQDLRVDHPEQAMVVILAMAAFGHIDHADPQRDTDLRSCDSYRSGA